MNSKRIFFTVTNDLTYDQRMHRICTSLANAGYAVTLVGRQLVSSRPLSEAPYRQKRLRCFFQKGFAFYAEYNLRLFFFLLRQKMDATCAIDLDTILAAYAASALKSVRRIYDAHEYFTELKEVRTRPFVRRFWSRVEAFAVPRFRAGYTVSEGLAGEFKTRYGVQFAVVRNLPVLRPLDSSIKRESFLVYQGAVNEARGFEILVPAMKQVTGKLVVCGDGNFMTQLKVLVRENGVGDKVELRGMLLPEELRVVAQQAALGIGLAEKEGLNQYYALPNKFLEYLHAGLPQIAMDFPEYRKINDRFPVAVLLDSLTVDGVAQAINGLLTDETRLQRMRDVALQARDVYCWQQEEKKLLHFYQQLFA